MSKPTEFNAGDKVTGPDGTKYVVVNHSQESGTVHVETAKGVKPYDVTFVSLGDLRKGHGAAAEAAPAGDPTTTTPQGEPPAAADAAPAGDPTTTPAAGGTE